MEGLDLTDLYQAIERAPHDEHAAKTVLALAAGYLQRGEALPSMLAHYLLPALQKAIDAPLARDMGSVSRYTEFLKALNLVSGASRGKYGDWFRFGQRCDDIQFERELAGLSPRGKTDLIKQVCQEMQIGVERGTSYYEKFEEATTEHDRVTGEEIEAERRHDSEAAERAAISGMIRTFPGF